MFGRRMFWEEGTARTETMSQMRAGHTWGKARKPVWLEQNEQDGGCRKWCLRGRPDLEVLCTLFKAWCKANTGFWEEKFCDLYAFKDDHFGCCRKIMDKLKGFSSSPKEKWYGFTWMRSDQIQDTANRIFWSETEKEGTWWFQGFLIKQLDEWWQHKMWWRGTGFQGEQNQEFSFRW